MTEKEKAQELKESGEPTTAGFRQSEHKQLASPEQLDQLLVVTSRGVWLTLYTITAVIICILLWSVYGSISIKVIGRGIVMNQRGLFSLQARASGTIQEIAVSSGDVVEEGQLVGVIYDPQEELQLRAVEDRVEKLEANLQQLREQISTEELAVHEALESDLRAKQFLMKQLQNRIPGIEEALATKQRLFEEGLITSSAVDEVKGKLYSTLADLETVKAAIAEIKSRLVKGYRTEELRVKEQALQQLVGDRDILELRREYHKVYSPSRGRVLEILVNQGQLVNVGMPIVWLEYPMAEDEPHILYGFVPVEMGKRIPVGARVQIELSTVNVQEHGALIGIVKEVSQFAVSTSHIEKTIPNPGMVKYLTGGQPAVVQIIVEPERDPSTYSGYRWTSGSGPQIKLSTGTVCTLKAIIERIRPLYYVFPVWWLKGFTADAEVVPTGDRQDATVVETSRRKPHGRDGNGAGRSKTT